MLSETSALFYNFNDDLRTRQIRRYLHQNGISTRTVIAPEFLQPLGVLFELPGFAPNSLFNLGGDFKEEMLVMKDFSEKQLDDFLRFIRSSGFAPIELKAILTPVNCQWNSLRLYQELTKERDAFQNQKSSARHSNRKKQS